MRRIRSVTGSVVLGVGGKPVIPAYGALSVTVQGSRLESPLGAQGEFYLENLPIGRHTATVESQQGSCSLLLEVPDSEKPFVNLGTLRCASGETP